MAYAAWSVVFGEQPSAAKWNILGTNDSSFNDGTGIGTGAISTTAIAADAVTDAKLVYGKIKARQGGSATDWGGTAAAGNTTYDTSATDVTIQVGTKALTAQTTAITFPTAFTYIPVVFVTMYGSGGVFEEGYIVNPGTTGFSFVSQSYTQTGNISWMAIGV